MGSYNFAGQYQQTPAPDGGGIVKREWFKTYTEADKPKKFDYIFQSWDTANKASEIFDFSVCTTWGVVDKCLYLIHVLRKQLEYPDLKRLIPAPRKRLEHRMFSSRIRRQERNSSRTLNERDFIRSKPSLAPRSRRKYGCATFPRRSRMTSYTCRKWLIGARNTCTNWRYSRMALTRTR
jgi:hypothetical protein